MSIITIIISAAIAAGISYLLHVLDKDNNSMEKVKRYADKRLTEFNQYFQIDYETTFVKTVFDEVRRLYNSVDWQPFHPHKGYENSIWDLLG